MIIPVNTNTVRCKNCGRLIPAGSSSCRYCGDEIIKVDDSDADSSSVQSTVKKRKKTGLFIVLGVLALFTVISVINSIVERMPKSQSETQSHPAQSQSYSQEPEFDKVDDAARIVNNPYVNNAPNKMLVSITRITLADDYTAVDLVVDNTHRKYSYITIDSETYIRANGKSYKMIGTDGIAISPGKTAIAKGVKTPFTFYFPEISKNTYTIDLVESGKTGWQFYGIRLD